MSGANTKRKVRTKLDKQKTQIAQMNAELKRLQQQKDALDSDIHLGLAKKSSLGESITSLTALKHEMEQSLINRASQLRQGAAFMTTLAEQVTFIEEAALGTCGDKPIVQKTGSVRFCIGHHIGGEDDECLEIHRRSSLREIMDLWKQNEYKASDSYFIDYWERNDSGLWFSVMDIDIDLAEKAYARGGN